MPTGAIRWIIGGAVAASALSACGTAAFQTVEQGNVRAWVTRSTDGSGEAKISGTARWVATDRCWVLEPTTDDPTVDPRTRWQAVIWPRGTEITSESPPTLVVANRTVTDGARIDGVGSGADHIPSELHIPPACRAGGLVLLNHLTQ
jgi:hypothetical protein